MADGDDFLTIWSVGVSGRVPALAPPLPRREWGVRRRREIRLVAYVVGVVDAAEALVAVRLEQFVLNTIFKFMIRVGMVVWWSSVQGGD